MLFLIRNAKLIGSIAAIIGLLSSLYAIKSHYVGVGYEKAKNELQAQAAEQIAKATQDAISQANKQIELALSKQQKIFDAELLRVKNEKQVEIITNEVIRNVDKIKYVNNCTSIGLDAVGLLNNSVAASNSSAQN